MHLKMSSGKWRPSCLGLNVLKIHLVFQELRARVASQEAHITQLKNLLQKYQYPEKDVNKRKHAKQRPFDFNKWVFRFIYDNQQFTRKIVLVFKNNFLDLMGRMP